LRGAEDRPPRLLYGILPQEKLRALFAESHLFLHPSELAVDGDQEGVPNSMLRSHGEWLAGSRDEARRHSRSVEHGTSGILVAERDYTALATAMLQLAGRPRAIPAAQRRLRPQRVAAEFDLQVQARVLEEIYAETIGEAAGRTRPGAGAR
jgi:glycosyltransferase involved in cell wall biosynthesis